MRCKLWLELMAPRCPNTSSLVLQMWHLSDISRLAMLGMKRWDFSQSPTRKSLPKIFLMFTISQHILTQESPDLVPLFNIQLRNIIFRQRLNQIDLLRLPLIQMRPHLAAGSPSPS